jgi:hypothetical protein
MSELSDPTLGLLIEITADNRLDLFTTSDLRTLLMRADLRRYGGGSQNKQELVRSALFRAREEADQGQQQAHRALLAFVRLVVEKGLSGHRPPRERFEELRQALLADGYDLSWEQEEDWSDWRSPYSRKEIRCGIRPTDAPPVPLAPEISALEAELADRGYDDARNHYQQAVDNFLHHNYETANGALRTTLEDLVTRLAREHTGYIGQGRPGEGGRAINHMVHSGSLPENDGGLVLKGVWQLAHTRGSHPGRSDADEARFRMMIITAIARFLLNRLPKVR